MAGRIHSDACKNLERISSYYFHIMITKIRLMFYEKDCLMFVIISESNYCCLHLTFWPSQLKTGDVQGFWQSLSALITLVLSTSLLSPVSQRTEFSALLFPLINIFVTIFLYVCALWLYNYFTDLASGHEMSLPKIFTSNFFPPNWCKYCLLCVTSFSGCENEPEAMKIVRPYICTYSSISKSYRTAFDTSITHKFQQSEKIYSHAIYSNICSN